jgi:hypothetical protein
VFSKAFYIIALVGCGNSIEIKPPTRCIKVDKSAEQYLAVLYSVIDEFNLQGGVIFDVSESCVGKTVYLATTNESWKDGYCGQRTNESDGDYVIYLCPTIRSTWYHLPIVLVHEIGHTFGMGHSNDPKNVMHWSTLKDEHTIEESVWEVLQAVQSVELK